MSKNKTDRRLIDKAELIEVRTLGSGLQVFQLSNEAQQASATFDINIQKNPLPSLPSHPNKLGLLVTVTIQLNVSIKGSPESRVLSANAIIAGVFAVESDVVLSDDLLKSHAGESLARLVYPIARNLVTQQLLAAKFADVPLAWDLGPSVELLSSR